MREIDHFTKMMGIHSKSGGGGHELFGAGFSIHHFPSKSLLVLGQERQNVVLTPIMGWVVWIRTSRTKMSSSNVQNSACGWQGGSCWFCGPLKAWDRSLQYGGSEDLPLNESQHSPSVPEQSPFFKVQFLNLQNLPNGIVSGLKCIKAAWHIKTMQQVFVILYYLFSKSIELS